MEQIKIPIELPDIFKSKDTIFHYCKLNTAIEHILYEKKLRLAPRIKAIDPIENFPTMIPSHGSYVYKRNPSEYPIKQCQEIRAYSEQIINSTRQVSFCQNFQTNIKSEENLDLYGFMNPRMWDQYADKYTGVCLAFSLKKLKENKSLINQNIKYLCYDDILKLSPKINENELLDYEDIEQFKKYFFKKHIKPYLFRKHKDYRDEKENRFIAFSNDEFVEIDITNSLVGIIISANSICDFSLVNLKKYSMSFNIPLIYIYWSGYMPVVISPERKDFYDNNNV